MIKIIAIISTIVVAVAIIFFIFKKDAPITNFPSDGKTIIAFGDSLTEGVGATKGNDFVSLLSRGIGQPIVNMGASGDTSTRGLARVDAVIEQDPKVVLLLLGGNDFLRKVPIAETFKNIDDIVVKIQNSGAMVILLGIQGGILSDHYDEYFEDIAKKRGTLYVDNVLDGLVGHQEYMSDTIHPNDAGYKKIVKRVLPVLEKSLGK